MDNIKQVLIYGMSIPVQAIRVEQTGAPFHALELVFEEEGTDNLHRVPIDGVRTA